jgi:lipoprotein-anchoring transpeptidase ErfK/SrfK
MMIATNGGSGAPSTMLKLGGVAANISNALGARVPPALLAVAALLLSSCATKDMDHQIVISAKDQKLALIEKGKVVATYPVSTSKYGLGDAPGSYRTPLGKMEVATKIGDGAPIGTVFKDRRRTGEVIPINAPGRDPIVTRIIWLRGLQGQNRNAFARDIYIHGTPEERNIGRPASYGCIRMRSVDVINLYSIVGPGADVEIVPSSLSSVIPGMTSASSMSESNHAGMVIR